MKDCLVWLLLVFLVASMMQMPVAETTSMIHERAPSEPNSSRWHDVKVNKRYWYSGRRSRCQIGGVCYHNNMCCSGFMCGGAVPGSFFQSCLKK